jgi:cobalamin biosynthesis protein CobD/CbiB
MNFFSLLFALALEQAYSLKLRSQLQLLFVRYANALERHLNAGEERHGIVAWVLAVLPPSLLVAVVYVGLYAIQPLAAWLWNALVLYLMMGFRQFSHPFTEIGEALQAGNLNLARRRLAEWRGDSGIELTSHETARLAIEGGILESHRHVFGTMLWFLLLPGPSGAVLYRLAGIVAEKWSVEETHPLGQELAQFGSFARRVFYWLDWLPVRLTAVSFAVVGDFEDAIYCWRTQAAQWQPTEQGIILASGAGALGVKLGEPLREVGGGVIYRPELGVGDAADSDLMQSAVGMIWRALVLWLAVVLLVTLAHWAG